MPQPIDQDTIDRVELNEENTKDRSITPIIKDRWGGKVIFEYPITDGGIVVENNKTRRNRPKEADYLLLYKDNIPLAIVEAKAEEYYASKGYQQAKDYALKLDLPFAYTTNGVDLIEIDLTTGQNRDLKIGEFPTMNELWNRYCKAEGLDDKMVALYTEPYYLTTTGKKPRYYQRIAINKTVLNIMKGQKRLLLVMATGTGKTFTAFQIVYRFWHTHQFKKILFLADRNILVDQTMKKDFQPFMDAMVKIDNNHLNTTRDIYLGLYQQLVTSDNDYYKQFPPDFFDLICIDECHRGSASNDSSWHTILEYFSSAVQLGMTATPKDGGIEDAYNNVKEVRELLQKAQSEGRKEEASKLALELSKLEEDFQKAKNQSNIAYFGSPIYVYSLKQGIEDGFLAPYKVISVELNIDKFGWKPPIGTVDSNGVPIPIRTYYQDDFDRRIVSTDRRKLVAKRISDFMKKNNRFAKTIVFCENIEHCEKMVQYLENENADLVKENPRYIAQITSGHSDQLENFMDSSSQYPTIAVTSQLMSTGVDAETCELIVLDRKIGSMTEFKQIVGRGTRIKEHYECAGVEKSKMFFTILDFRKNYLKFNDPDFDGEPLDITVIGDAEDFIGMTPISEAKTEDTYKERKPRRKLAVVNGINVEIVNEDVLYRDKNGNLVTQDLTSCTRNNIVTQYPTYDEFKSAWLQSTDKMGLALSLLLDNSWVDKYKEQYGYTVDEFDIIACIGYDIEPPRSKVDRTKSQYIVDFLNKQTDDIKAISEYLLQVYAESSFMNLRRDLRELFSMPEIDALGFTLTSVMTLFGGKQNYMRYLNELEELLYQD